MFNSIDRCADPTIYLLLTTCLLGDCGTNLTLLVWYNIVCILGLALVGNGGKPITAVWIY